MLHGSVDDGYQGYVGHIADIIVDQELEVGNVDDSNVPMVIMYKKCVVNILKINTGC